jgi:hypothetical protein
VTPAAIDLTRYDEVRREWLAISARPPIDQERFATAQREADALVAAGRWVSGPSDMLTVLGRQRDELLHSRLIAWLLVPTNRHGMGRAALAGFLDALWPGDGLMRSGPVSANLEVPGSGLDADGRLHEARADVVLRGDGVTVVIENKVDAGEQPAQCERLYWAWAGEPGDTRWVYLTPTGRPPVTTSSPAAAAAWRSMSYAELRTILEAAFATASSADPLGRATAGQYLETLIRSVVPNRG